MDPHIAKPEDFVGEIRERQARIEARLDTTATKADLHELQAEVHDMRSELQEKMHAMKSDLGTEILGLRAEMHREFTAQTWCFIMAMTTVCTALTAGTYFIATHVSPTAAPSPLTGHATGTTSATPLAPDGR